MVQHNNIQLDGNKYIHKQLVIYHHNNYNNNNKNHHKVQSIDH